MAKVKYKPGQKLKGPDPISDRKQWLVDYINSPKYRENLSKEFEHSQLNLKDVDKEIKSRSENVKSTKVVEKQLSPKGYNFLRGLSKSDEKKVLLDPNVRNIDPDLVVHELAHSSTEDGKTITPFAKRLIKSGNSKKSYYTEPTEVHGRLTELKYLLDSGGYYDPKTESINKELLEKSLNDPKIRRKLDVRDLKDNFSTDDILLMLNNIAGTRNETVPVAKHGGKIKNLQMKRKYKGGGKINFDDINIDETMSGINLIASLTGEAINSIGNEYDIAALNKQVNPYFAKHGGNVSGAKQFDSPSHEEGGEGITEHGSKTDNPTVEIEKDEILYKFRHIPVGDYVFSSENGTASMARKILNKYAVKSKDSKTPDVITDPLIRSKMEVELKDVVDINEKINALREAEMQMQAAMEQQEQQVQEQPAMRYGGVVKKMRFGDPVGEDASPLEKGLEDIISQVGSEAGLSAVPGMNLMRGLAEVAEKTKPAPAKNKINSSKGALARGSTLFLDALDSFKKPLSEAPILPDFSESDAAMRSMSADLTSAQQDVLGAYNEGTMQVRNSSNSLQQLSARQQGLSGNLSDQLMKLAAQKRAMVNEIAGQKVAYESGKATTNAQTKYQNRIDNLQNQAARQQFVERARDNMLQMGMHLDNMDLVEKQTAEGNRILASMGNYFKILFDERGNPVSTTIKTGKKDGD